MGNTDKIGVDTNELSPLKEEEVKNIPVTSSTKKKKYKFLFAANSIPRRGTKGEDAYFVTERALGVADGVSGWYQYGIDSADFSRQLMKNCEKETLSYGPDEAIDLLSVLSRSYAKDTAIGSSTATLVAINGDTLYGLNLGDSGFMRFSKIGRASCRERVSSPV